MQALVAASLTGPLWPLLFKASLTLLQRSRLTTCELSSQFDLGAPPLANLASYRHLLGFAHTQLPLCWFYPLLQKAQLASMLHIKGLPVAGLIHLRNELTACGPIEQTMLVDKPLSVHTELRLYQQGSDWLLAAEQELYQHQSHNLLLQGRSEYLVKKGAERPQRAPLPSLNSAALLQQWDCQQALARRYAALSGDWNPIHLWHWSARLFGQPAVLLHGMASAALLEARLPKPASQLQLEFIKPVRPGTALQLRQASPSEFWLCSQDRLCLRAEVG